MRLIRASAAILRRLRVERTAALTLFALIAVTSFLAAAAPRAVGQVADAGLRDAIERSTAAQRNLRFSTVGGLPAQEGDSFARVRARGDVIWETLPTSIQDIIGERGFALESTRVRLTDPPNFTTLVTLVQREGISDQVELLDGRWPARSADPASDPAAPPRFEIAISEATATTTHVVLGDVLPARVDSSDPLLQRTFPRPTTAVELEVVGLLRVRDPDAPYWNDDHRLQQAAIAGTEDNPIALTQAVFAEDAYQDIRQLELPWTYRWQFTVAAERIAVDQLAVLVPDLRRLESRYGTASGPADALAYRTGLLGIIEAFEADRATSVASVSVAALGPLAVAAGAVGLIGLVIVRRRATAIDLARARGASPRQLLVAQLGEGLLVGGPAAAVGLVAAVLVIPGRDVGPSATAALLVATGATVLLLAASWAPVTRARRARDRADAPARGVSPRRLVIETTIVGLAVAATWLLRERTVAGSGAVGDVAGPDPFLAAAPVLIGLAVGIVAMRLYPFPIRAMAALGAARRDLVPVLALRVVGRQPGLAALPLLVLTLTVAVGVFSTVIVATIDRGQTAVTWQAVGADHRIDAPDGSMLDASLDPESVAGVEAVAPAISIAVPPSRGAESSTTRTLLHAVDASALQAVLADTPAAIEVPAALADDPSHRAQGIGTEAQPIPAVVSAKVPNGWATRAVGDTFVLDVRGQALTFRIAGVADSFPGIPGPSTFVVAPFAAVVAAHDASPIAPTILFIRGPASVVPGIEERMAKTPSLETRTTRDERFAAIHDAPLVAAVGAGFGVALGIAAAYAALAVIAVVLLDSARRSREVAYLRTLGLSDRQLTRLTIIEQAPQVVAAVLIGTAAGALVAWLVEPGLSLATFIDPDVPVALAYDASTILAVGALVLAVVIAAVGIGTAVARRLAPVDALRMGEG